MGAKFNSVFNEARKSSCSLSRLLCLVSGLLESITDREQDRVPHTVFFNLSPHRQVSRVMLMDQDTQWLYQLLAEVQLEKFYLRVRDGLNITRVEHFSYVKESDLEHIGISKPGKPQHRRVLSDRDGFSSGSVINVLRRVKMSPSVNKHCLLLTHSAVFVFGKLLINLLDLQHQWING